MTESNQKLSQLFHDLASIYRFLGGENPFRSIAYQNASRSIQGLPEDIAHYIEQNTLGEIPGIGKSLEHDIIEFQKTGKISRFEKFKKKVPFELMQLMDIRGFGPQSLKRLYKELHLENKEQVIRALKDGSIRELKGFGDVKIENMLRGLKLHKALEERMLLWDALQYGEEILTELRNVSGVKSAELAGSLRRKKETVGDFDILIAAAPGTRRKIIEYFISSSFAKKVLAKGDTKVSVLLKRNGRQMDLRIVDESEWGAALQYFTGSKEHNIHLRSIARNKGYRISEYGIFNIGNEKRIAGKTEDEIYGALGMQTIPPEMREDRGEIQMAMRHEISALIELGDIKGDLQMHSNWSDGDMTLDELVEFVKKKYSYEYIAVTDHTKTSRIAGGMDEKGFLEQIEAVRKVNAKLGNQFLKAGAEVDILPDGSLDLSDEVLEQLDWVTASIHSSFTRDNTDRLIKACENPYVQCIGHPTGRLIGKREPYLLEISKLIEAAKETGTTLEINAQPDRMDLNDELAALARQSSVKLVISTDSHKAVDFDFMRLGVFVAKRAWCTADDILNTRSWRDIQTIVRKKQLHSV